jgi:hypothetical protein
MSPTRKRQFVFVSHANADKEHIRFILDALIAEGVKVWLDNPAALKFTREEIEGHFHQLSGGGRWRTQIDEAVNEAMCVLVIWSKTSAQAGRNVILDEAAIGRSQKKLVCCRIDGIDPQSLPNGFDEQQTLDLYAAVDGQPLNPGQRAERARGLVTDIRGVMERMSREGLESREQRDDFTPYLIDRRKQEEEASRIIRRASEGGVHAVFVQGPKNECLDQFRERLRRYTSADCLANGLSWQELLVDWPAVDDPRAFADAYEAALATAMRVRVSEVRARLLQHRQAPVAAVSVVGMGEWSKKQRQLILAWLKWWKGVAAASSEAKCVPVLAVDLPAVKPGWKNVPPIRQEGVSAEKIWKDVGWAQKQAAGKPRDFAPLARLDVLHPVRLGDADQWLRKLTDSTSGDFWKSVQGEIGVIFAGPNARKGVSMKDFAERMAAKLKQTP